MNLNLGVDSYGQQERKVLLLCNQNKLSTIAVVDTIKIESKQYVLIEHPKGLSLRETVLSLGKTSLSEAETKKCIFQLLKIVKKLHKLSIKHANLNLDSILTKTNSKTNQQGRLEIKLKGFEKSFVHKIPRRVSSENIGFATQAKKNSKSVTSTVEKELSGDILAIGILTYTLLNDVRDISDVASVQSMT